MKENFIWLEIGKSEGTKMSSEAVTDSEESDTLYPITEEDQLSSRSSSSCDLRLRSGRNSDFRFLYQRLEFKSICGNVPQFVRSNCHKTCRFLPETFILRLNFLRKRRETSTEIVNRIGLQDEDGVKRPKQFERTLIFQNSKSSTTPRTTPRNIAAQRAAVSARI